MPKNKTIYHQDHDDENSVYMYYNDKWNIKLFVNADGFDEAMKMFDICDFDNRDEWSIYLRCGQQPIKSIRNKNERKTR